MTDQDPLLHPSISGSGEVGHAGLGSGPVRPGEYVEALPASGTSALAAGSATRRRRGVRVTTAAAVALGLAIAGGVAGAASSSGSSGTPSSSSGTTFTAQSGGMATCGSPPAAVGTVKSVGNDTFTLTTASGSTVTVDVGSATKYVDPSVSSPSFSNVTVGEHVAVMGTESSNTVTATSVLIGSPSGMKGLGGFGPGGPGGPGGPPAAVGTVQSVGANTFTLTTASGSTVTVDVGSSTKYVDPSVSSPSFSSVTVGEHVAVIGTDSSNTVSATTVLIGAPPARMAPPGSGSGSSSSNTATSSISGGFTTT